jgi:hypothetical protein
MFDPSVSANGCANENYCRDLPHGQCLAGNIGASRRDDECFAECQVDADCKPDELCLCDAQLNHCIPTNCHSDAECGPGLLCIATSDPANGTTPFTCQNADDDCTATCAGYDTSGANGVTLHMTGGCGLTVRDDGSTHRDCSYFAGTGGSCGRPFLVQGAALIADAVPRRDWASPSYPAPDCAAVTPELRRALAASWLDAALMEHASVAAFARFSLELLALAAPPDLQRDAAQAMADEQRFRRAGGGTHAPRYGRVVAARRECRARAGARPPVARRACSPAPRSAR